MARRESPRNRSLKKPGPRGFFGEAEKNAIVERAKKRDGILVPEIMDRYDVSYRMAYGVVQRLITEGRLRASSRRRARRKLYTRGASGIIYRATAQEV